MPSPDERIWVTRVAPRRAWGNCAGRPRVSADESSGLRSSAVHELVNVEWDRIDEYREQMRVTGAAEISAFVRPDALDDFIADARQLSTARAPQRWTRHRLPRISRRVVPARSSAPVARQLRPGRRRVRLVPARLADSPACTSGRSSAFVGRDPRTRHDLSVRGSARCAEPGGDGRRRRAAVALRPDRFRRVARVAGCRRRWRLRSRAAHPHGRRRELRRRARVLAGKHEMS